MDGVLKEFFYSIGITTDGLSEGLEKAESSVSSSVKKIGDDLASMAKSFLAPIVSAAAFKSAFDSYLGEADRLGKLSQSLKMSMEDLQAWSGAAERAGGSADGFQSTVRSLQGKLDQAKITGSLSGMTDLNRLGVSAYDGAEKRLKTPIELLKDLAKSAEGMDSDKFRIRAQSLGIDEGTIRMLQGGSAALDELISRQKALGLYTEKDAEISLKFKNAMSDVQQVFKAIASVVMRVVLPPIQYVIDKFADLMIAVKDHERFVKVFAAALTALLIPAFVKVAAAAAPLLVVAGLITGVALAIDDLMAYASGGGSALAGIWEAIFGSQENAEAAINAVVSGLGLVKEIAGTVLSAARDLLIDLLGYIADGVKKMREMWNSEGVQQIMAKLGQLKELAQTMLSTARDLLIDLSGYIADSAEKMRELWNSEGVQQVLAELERLKTFIGGLIEDAGKFWDRFKAGGISEILAVWKNSFVEWWDSLMGYFKEKLMSILPDWLYKRLSGHSKSDSAEVEQAQAEAKAAARENVLQGRTEEEAAQQRVESGEFKTIEAARAQVSTDIRTAEKTAGSAAKEEAVKKIDDRDKVIKARREYEQQKSNDAYLYNGGMLYDEADAELSEGEIMSQWREGKASWVTDAKKKGLGDITLSVPQADPAAALPPSTTITDNSSVENNNVVNYNIDTLAVEKTSDLPAKTQHQISSASGDRASYLVSNSVSGVNVK